MIETFLRRPADAGEVLADVLRLVGLVSAVVAGVVFGPVYFFVFALTLLGLVVPRFLGVRPGVDIATGVVLLVAAWSAALDLYVTAPPVDIPVHLLLNGLLAALAAVLLVRTRVLPKMPRVATVLVTTALGLSLGVLWEFGEWAGNTFVDADIFVSYDDTIGDLAVGGLGSLLAGLAMPWVLRDSRWRGTAADVRERRTAP
ncbi:hypothetical protein [Desertivibrio insolitus]|uniref:hypothetical protein n=1 Tax=Herbiconiux sp. SYSU D00978 TaxID=2812562 RepID=UPI001A9799E8|nr:hypothetical protein [Herbiconiux sp. SYSU D00978]